jgi:Fe-S oxidoreductase
MNCGFGGTFSIFEEPVSAKMGYDKVADHHAAGANRIRGHVVPHAPARLRRAVGP